MSCHYDVHYKRLLYCIRFRGFVHAFVRPRDEDDEPTVSEFFLDRVTSDSREISDELVSARRVLEGVDIDLTVDPDETRISHSQGMDLGVGLGFPVGRPCCLRDGLGDAVLSPDGPLRFDEISV